MNNQYELWINLPSSITDVQRYLGSQSREVLLSEEIFEGENFKRWKAVVQFDYPIKDVKGIIESGLDCKVIGCFKLNKELENAN